MKPIFKSTLFLSLLFCLFTTSYGASYHFSTSTGDDSRSPSEAQNPNTPWKTIKKLNEFFPSLSPGDQILFRRGEVFYGSIHMRASGSESAPIKISAYGTGENPQITSFVSVAGWQSVGQSRHRSTNTIIAKEVKVVLLDGKIQEMGRFPNTESSNGGFLKISTAQGSGYITSTELSSSPNFTNGEVVIRKVLWVTDRHKITSHSGSALQFGIPIYNSSTTNYKPYKGWGFFIQNHLETLDVFGEWFFNEQDNKISVHFGTSNPNNHTVEVSTLDNLLTKTFSVSNITIDNLSFRGSNKDAINIVGGRNIKITNTTIEFVGEDGIQAIGINGLEISKSIVRNALNNGIMLRRDNNSTKILENKVENIAPFAGGMRSGDSNGIGINVGDNNSLVEYNEVINTGYNGISFRRSNIKISNNFIRGYCIHKTDGGGIYSFGGASGLEVFSNRVISKNIIVEGKGTLFGTPYFGVPEHINRKAQASGIFLDDNVNNIIVENNTIAHSPHSGITISNAKEITVKNNTFYDNGQHASVGNYNRGGDTRNIQFEGNILFSKESDQLYYFIRSQKDDVKEFGQFDNNYFVNPLGDDYSISVGVTVNSTQTIREYTPEKWRDAFGKDTQSTTSAFKIPGFKLNNIKGNNLYATGDFESNLVGIGCTSCAVSKELNVNNNGTLKVVNTEANDGKSVRFALNTVEKDKNYILKFKAKSNRTGTIKAFLRFSGTPWQRISKPTSIELSTATKEYTVLFTSKITLNNPALVLENVEPNWTFWIDDLELHEADVELTDPDRVFLFEYNGTKSAKTILLDTEYISGKNRSYSNSIELEPFSSILLIRKSGEGPVTEATPPSIKINHTNGNTPIIEGDNVKFEADITATSDIKTVDYYANDKQIGSTTSAPFAFTWQNVPRGTHMVTANVTDAAGNNIWSSDIKIEVTAPKTDIGAVEVLPPNVPVNENAFQMYLNVGSTESVNFEGSLFSGENQGNQFYNASNTFTYDEPNLNQLYQTGRWARNLSYSIPVPNGEYTVKTIHIESRFGQGGNEAQAGQRVFDISIENEKVKENFDLFVYNNNNPTTLTFTNIIVEDGILNLNLDAKINNPTISGLVILQTNLSVELEYHISIGSDESTTYNGITFSGEGLNGETIANGTRFRNSMASDDELFKKDQYGKNINISMPVPNGIYKIMTYHNELRFGLGTVEARVGQRVYDISIEGIRVKENFDLNRENNNQQTTLVFDNVIVNDNQLDVELIAISNNASISAISIISEKTENTDFNLFLNAGDMEDQYYN